MRNRQFMPPLIIGVCGGSGSGKTTFCKQLVMLLGDENVAHLKQDDYYRDLRNLTQDERDLVNFDHPDSVEFDLLSTHLDYLLSGEAISVPSYDFATHTRTTYTQIVHSKPIVLIEGILLFSSDTIANKVHHKIFIDTKDDIRFDRRLRRDIAERGRTQESVLEQFNSTVKPMHDLFVEPKKKLADEVISGEVPFDDSLHRLHENLVRHLLKNK